MPTSGFRSIAEETTVYCLAVGCSGSKLDASSPSDSRLRLSSCRADPRIAVRWVSRSKRSAAPSSSGLRIAVGARCSGKDFANPIYWRSKRCRRAWPLRGLCRRIEKTCRATDRSISDRTSGLRKRLGGRSEKTSRRDLAAGLARLRAPGRPGREQPGFLSTAWVLAFRRWNSRREAGPGRGAGPVLNW